MDPSQGTGVPPLYFSKASDVSFATASYTPRGTSTQAVGAGPAGSTNNVWYANGWYPDNTGFPSATTTPYFDFVLDTSKYGGVRISSQHYIASGDWAAVGNNYLYIYSKADNGAFSTIYNAQLSKGSWQTIPATPAATTGTSTTTFRINAVGSKDTTKYMYIDTIIFTGCKKADPPTITKSFSPASIALNDTSTLTFTITNPNTGMSLSGVSVTDTFPVLPAGMTVASPLTTTNTCGGTLQDNSGGTLEAGDQGIRLTGGAIAAGGSCSFSVKVKASAAGLYQNASDNVSATESGANTTGGANVGYAVASLTVIAPPSLAMSFSPSSIFTTSPGNTSTLTFTITNPNQSNSLSGIGFTDTLPAGLTVTTSGPTATCGGLLSTTSPNSISFTGGSLTAGSSCSFSVTVTGTTAGTKNNTTAAVTSNEGGSGNTATNSIVVIDRAPSIDLTKQVSTSTTGPWTKYLSVAAGNNVYYRFRVYNSGDTPLYNIGIIETAGSINPTCTWPEPLAVGEMADCVAGPVTAVAGSNVNTAYATAKYPSGGSTYNSANSSATYATTDLTITKSAMQPYFTAIGNVLDYNYVVTNTGFATLSGPVTIADDKTTDETCPSLTTIGDHDNYFDPSESITCTATYTIVEADVTAQKVTNIATATVGGVTSPEAQVTVPLAAPSLTVLKSVVAYSDPVNETTNPKAIPGSIMQYTILVMNTGPGHIDNNTTVIIDPIPANTELFVGDIGGAGSGPILFTTGPSCSSGTAVSGLSYSFNGLSDTGDSISFSKSNGSTYDQITDIPSPDANGYDAAVTHFKVSLSGIFNGTIASGGSNTSFCLQYRVRVK